MKKSSLILAACLLAACILPLQAQTTGDRILAIEETNVAIQNSIDSLSEKMSAAIADSEAAIGELREGKSRVKEIRNYSEIAMKWVCLLLFAVFLPLLLAKLYLNKSKEDQRRYDIIVDLIRSGVEIKPEMLEYLTGTNTRSGQTIHSGALSGMNQTDVNYCSKRLLWAVCLLVIGFTISMIANEGIVFGIFACVAVIFAAQAVVRYFSVKYFNQHKDIEQKKDAE